MAPGAPNPITSKDGRSLGFFFHPRSVAVVGASRVRGKVGRLILENILGHGFRGAVHPVNPKGRAIMGRRVYPSVAAIPEPVDLAVIAVPAKAVPTVVAECAAAGVRGAIIISSGFKESGLEGASLESQITRTAADAGLRLIGPNCLGLIDTSSRLNASFAGGMPASGKMAFFSQSGALCSAILDWALDRGVGFSRFVSIGNKADIDEVSMLEALAEDASTRVILGYLEGVKDGEGFIRAASRVTPVKPVIISKSGTTQAGARAAASHTGTLTGSEVAFQAACEAAGIIRAGTVGELFNYALLFASQPLPGGRGLAVITNAGGPGIMAADSAEKSGVPLASLGPATIEALRAALPPAAGLYNPVDLGGDARADRFGAALKAVLPDPAVAGALVLLTPQITTEPDQTARVAARLASKSGKTVVASFMGGLSVRRAAEVLRRASIPNYEYPEHAVQAFEAMLRYRAWRLEDRERAPLVEADRRAARETLSAAREAGRLQLAESGARGVLAAYGFTLIDSVLARNAGEAAAAAARFGGPVAMKISSEQILHKSDIGGVRLGVAGEAEARRAFAEILDNARRYFPLAAPDGVLVQPMVTGAREVIVGATRDPAFGPVVMFGLGGIHVELLRDVAYRLAPLGPREAMRMIGETRGSMILQGWRGSPPSDVEAAADCVVRLSALMTDFPEILEAEINPLAVLDRGKGAVAVDARIIVKED